METTFDIEPLPLEEVPELPPLAPAGLPYVHEGGISFTLQLDKLAGALAAAQGEFSPAEKDSYNGHLNSHYSSINAILQACRQGLSRHSLAVVQMPWREPVPQGSTAIPKINMVTRLMHSSGQWIQGDFAMELVPGNNPAHRVGSTITYLRRATLPSTLGVAAGDSDDDGNAQGDPGAAKVAPSAPTPPRPKPNPKLSLDKPGDRPKSPPAKPADAPAESSPKPAGEMDWEPEDRPASSAEIKEAWSLFQSAHPQDSANRLKELFPHIASLKEATLRQVLAITAHSNEIIDQQIAGEELARESNP